MNKIIVIVTVISLSCLFCQCTKHAGSREENIFPTGEMIITEGDCFPDVADKYVYPIKYGTDEWYMLFPDAEKFIKEWQLPDDVLKSISTLGLICSFIDVPYLIMEGYQYSSDSSPLRTSYRIYSQFNSVQELLIRKDAAKALISYYAATKLDCYELFSDCYNSYTDCYELICGGYEDDCFELLGDCFNILNDCREQREFSYRLCALEYLFTMPEILGSLSHIDKQEAVKLLLANSREYNPDCIRDGNLTVMVWIMYDEMVPYFDKKSLDYIKYESIIGSLAGDIISFAESFINKNQ